MYDYQIEHGSMLDYIEEQTDRYLKSMPKDKRKKHGQFFTGKDTAVYMSQMFDIPDGMHAVSILDAGAGMGMLSCALLERIIGIDSIKEINLTCYESDANILGLLKDSIESVCRNTGKIVNVNIIADNYITSHGSSFADRDSDGMSPKQYDFVIGNPPYIKLPKNAPEAECMKDVCHGAPNMYALFAAMGLFDLRMDGELVYIIPRSWMSGDYFRKFREYFLAEGKIMQIHLFVSRSRVFGGQDVLQETVIVKAKKTKNLQGTVKITSSYSGNGLNSPKEIEVPYNIIAPDSSRLYLPVTDDDMAVIAKVHRFKNTLVSLGMRMKTGVVVGFRHLDEIKEAEENGAVPMFRSQHVIGGHIQFPIGKKQEYIVTDKNALLLDNKDYLFVRRIAPKENARRLQCGIYLSEQFPQYHKISTDQSLDFVCMTGDDTGIPKNILYGLYALFNSTLYDQYYRIVNGSTQVNSTEMNAVPIPEISVIRDIGKMLMESMDMSEESCDRILSSILDDWFSS